MRSSFLQESYLLTWMPRMPLVFIRINRPWHCPSAWEVIFFFPWSCCIYEAFLIVLVFSSLWESHKLIISLYHRKKNYIKGTSWVIQSIFCFQRKADIKVRLSCSGPCSAMCWNPHAAFLACLFQCLTVRNAFSFSQTHVSLIVVCADYYFPSIIHLSEQPESTFPFSYFKPATGFLPGLLSCLHCSCSHGPRNLASQHCCYPAALCLLPLFFFF